MAAKLDPAQLDGRPRDDPGREPELPGAGEGYGFPARLWRSLDRHAPPGAGLHRRWRSPLRGPWLTSVFGAVLLVGLPIVIITGLLSYMAYAPQFGQAVPRDVGWLKLPAFDWPSHPAWLYRRPKACTWDWAWCWYLVVAAKLWSVIPRHCSPGRRFVRSPRCWKGFALLMLVGGILLEIVTGLLFIQYDFLFGFIGTWCTTSEHGCSSPGF